MKIIRELLADPEQRARLSSRAREMYNSETTDQCAQIIDALLGEADYPELRPEPEISSDRVLDAAPISWLICFAVYMMESSH